MPVDPLEEARERLEALTEVADWLRREAAATMDTGYRGSFRPTVVQLERWAAVAERARCALAAAPPPPGVSRGLDREEVARIIALAGLGTITGNGRWIPPTDKWDPAEWHQRVLECVPGDVERRCYETADAIIALSAPAGGGMDSLRPSGAPQPALGGKPPLDEPESAAGAIPSTGESQ